MTKKINFCGFWKSLNPEDNFFTNTIREYYPVEISDDPDYLFCSVFSNKFVYNEKAVRIFYTGECQTPDFNLFDYAMGFDYLTLGDRYCRLPLYLLYGDELLNKAEDRAGMIKNPVYRDRFCSFVYSNPNADPIREEFFRKLDARMNVDSGGRYLNNIGAPVEDKTAFESKYRFSIAFENCSYPGYLSEKVIQAFAAGTIPIYWGDTEADKTLNPEAYINVNSFGSIDQAVDYVLEINNDQDKYLKMLSRSVFVDEDLLERQKKDYTLFIKSIFDRSREEAYRRNTGMRGRNYELFFKRYTNFEETIRSIKRVFRK